MNLEEDSLTPEEIEELAQVLFEESLSTLDIGPDDWDAIENLDERDFMRDNE